MVKFKTRYLLVELIFSTDRRASITDKDVFDAIVYQVTLLYGDLGCGTVRSTMTIKICDVATNIVVIRIGAESVDYVTSAIPFIVCIGPEAAVLMTHFIGSSIRSCEKKLLQINRDQLHVKFASAKTPQEKQFIQKAICATTGNAGMKAAERITVCLTELFGPKQ